MQGKPNNTRLSNLKATIIIVLILVATRMIGSLPWWSFVVPVLILGIVLALKKWQVSGFGPGFLAGFLVWLGASIYYDMALPANTFSMLGKLFSIPPVTIFILSGFIGGLLTGLAFYTGKYIVYKPGENLQM